MENIMMRTRNVAVLLALITALFVLISLFGGQNFSQSVLDVIMTMFE